MKDSKKKKTGSARLRHGGYAAIVTVLVLACIVLANLVVGQIPVKIDLSKYKMYSLSDQSYTLLKDIKEEITIYAAFKPGSEPASIAEVLKRYKDASPKLKIEYIDVEKNPGFAKKYDTTGEGVAPGSIVVVGTKTGRFKVIPYMDLYQVSYNQETGESTVQGVATEQRVTGALLYVGSGRTAKILQTEGHNEFSLSDFNLEEDVKKENNEVATINLLSSKEVPAATSLLIVLSPKIDFQKSEAESVKNYLDKGGNALFIIDLLDAALPNIESIINLYGIATIHGVVMEGSTDSMVAGNPFFLLPSLSDHSTLKSIKEKKYFLTVPGNLALKESELKKKYIALSSLLTSSKNSWVRTDLEDNSPTRIASDIAGSQILAYASEAQKDDPTIEPTRLVVLGGSTFVNPQNPYMSPGNKEFFLNVIAWTQNRNDELSVRPKSVFQFPLQLDGLLTLVFLGVVVVLIPGSVLAAGLVVWLRRRHR